jgi:hypothetical protein
MLQESLEIFDDILGRQSYFRAAAVLEIANAHLRMQEYDQAAAFLEVASTQLSDMFPKDHPIYMKHLNYVHEVASMDEKT